MATVGFDTSAAFAAEMDARDPLASFRDQFHIPPAPDGGPSIYLCGHSLGLQPKRAREYIEQELERLGKAWCRGAFSRAQSLDAVSPIAE